MGASSSSQRIEESADGTINLLTVIVPALNEERRIKECLSSVRDHGLKCDPEVIVVDGGSTDRTVRFAKASGAKVVLSEKGRGRQLNYGWKISRGDWLLFLHADSCLPPHYGKSMQETIYRNPSASWGCFDSIKTDVSGLSMWLVTMGVRLRTWLLHLPYGDQAFFAKASALEKVDGFKDSKLLEDVDFVLKTRRNGIGRPMLVPDSIFTSGRRWQELGVWNNVALNQFILVAYFMGVDTDTLAAWYYLKKSNLSQKG